MTDNPANTGEVDSRVAWALESGEERSEKHPENFQIPSLEDRQNLLPGQAVQLMFRILITEANDNEKVLDESVERMWVIVLGKHRTEYIGILDNQPLVLGPESGILDRGMSVTFEAKHVINITTFPREYLEKTYPGNFPGRRDSI